MDAQYKAEKVGEGIKNFFNSNSLISRIVFIILVIIVLNLLINLGTTILAYFMNPQPNVILINGMIRGRKQKIFPADPSVKGSVPILRSRDQLGGIAFTWSNWIFINGDGITINGDRFKHIFNKGTHTAGVDGIMEPNNGPGLYITPNNHPKVAQLSLLIRMNIFTNEQMGNPLTKQNRACFEALQAYNDNPNNKSPTQNVPPSIKACQDEFSGSNISSVGIAAPNIFDDINVPDIPINKWVSVIIRCENNNIIDVYINGRLVRRHQLSGVARQNYGNVNVGLNGGFDGYLSELRYFNYAIGTAEIDAIVDSGPNLKSEDDDMTRKPQYLANRWLCFNVCL